MGSSDQRFGSLIDTIAERALDDDYYEVRSGRYSRANSRFTWRVGVVLAVFSLLVTIAAIQVRNDRSVVQAQRSTLIATIQEREGEIARSRSEVRDLQAEIDVLRDLREQQSGQAIERARIGFLGASGPGMRIVIAPSEAKILAFDLQRVVNGLWQTGAEAVAINGQRLTALSSIRSASGAVIVNYRSLSAPFTIVAIGEPQRLAEDFAAADAGRYLEQRVQHDGLSVKITEDDQINLPAAPSNRVTLKHAQKGG